MTDSKLRWMLKLICERIRYTYLRTALLVIGVGKMSGGGRSCSWSVNLCLLRALRGGISSLITLVPSIFLTCSSFFYLPHSIALILPGSCDWIFFFFFAVVCELFSTFWFLKTENNWNVKQLEINKVSVVADLNLIHDVSNGETEI